MVAGCKRIVFPSQTVSKRQLGSDLPAVPRVQSPGCESQCVWIDVLNDLAVPLRKTEQELRKTVVGIRRRVLWRAIQGGHASVKPESAAGCAKRSALRLKVINPAAVVFQSEPQVMSPLNPAQVCVNHVLIVAEDERIAGVSIS